MDKLEREILESASTGGSHSSIGAQILEKGVGELKPAAESTPLNAGTTPPEELAEITRLLETAELEKQTPPTSETTPRGGRGTQADPTKLGPAIENALKEEALVGAADIEKARTEKDALLVDLADLRVREKQAQAENLSEGTKTLIQDNLRRVQKRISDINRILPNVDPAEDNAKVQQTINEWTEAKRVTTKPEVAQESAPETVAPLALVEEAPSVQEIASPIKEEQTPAAAPIEQSGYSTAMERIWKENEAKREAMSNKGSIENLALEPRIPEYRKPEEVLSAPVGEAGPHLVTTTVEQGPVTVEGFFTRVPEGQELGPVLTPEEIQQAKLEKIRAKLDKMTGVVEARAEKTGMMDKIRKVGEMWNKVPKRYKYMLAAGVFLSGVGATAAGSAVAGAAVGTLATALRALSGAALFGTIETALKHNYEKKMGGQRSQAIETRHMLLASIGAIAFTALVPKIVSDYMGSEIIHTEAPGTAAAALLTETPPQVVPKIEYVVGQGGTLWGGITEQLNTQGTFAGMQEGQKTYVIDALKDKFAAMSPEELRLIGIGSGNIDVIHPGDHIDLTKVLGDTQLMPDVVRHAEALTPGQIYSIEHPAVAHPITGVAPEVSVPAPETTTAIMPQEIAPIDPAIIAAADDIVTNYVDENFGTKGFLGFGAQHGVDSIDWKDAEVGFANQSVDNVMSAHPSAFPSDGARHFGVEDYSATQKMQTGLIEVQKETGINSRPAETVADYLKRAAVTTLSGQSTAESVTQRT